MRCLQTPPSDNAAVPAATSEVDARAVLRQIMDSIPVSKDGVYSYAVKWDAYDTSTVAVRVGKWVSKKISELLGVEEPDLTEFILELLKKRVSAQQMQQEIGSILDNETSTFVLKLYRMVIYETEKAALGLQHSNL